MPPHDPDMTLTLLQRHLPDALSATHESFASLAEATRRVRMLEAMIETVPVGVVVAEAPSGRIILGNRQMEILVGHPIIHSSSIDAYAAWVAHHADGRQVQPSEWPIARVIREGLDQSELDVLYQRGDGTARWMRVVAQPVKDGDGSMIGAAVAMIDIDDEHRMHGQQQLVIAELNHRAKNLIAVVKSIVGQTLRREQVSAMVIDKVSDRLDAYARAHAQLTALAGHSATVEEIARETLRGHIDEGRITVRGPHCLLPERTAMALSMAFHELATNAMKHGSLAANGGAVRLEWSVDQEAERRMLSMRWQEHGGPAPTAPASDAQKGFGSIVIDRALTMQARGKVAITYPATGLLWHFVAPLPDPD